MSTESPVDNTPVTQNPRKRELTSPEFDIENKKNRIASETSDESETSETQTYTGNMASEHIEVMDIHAVPPAGPTITIPPSEMLKLSEFMLKLSELLKDTFHTEIVGIVDNIVKGVITGIQERITSLEKSNKDLQDANVSLTARVTSVPSIYFYMIFFLLIVLVCIVCSLDVGMGVPVQQVSNFQLLVGLVSVFVFLFLINEIT